MGIETTLRDIARKSQLNKAEKKSMRLIAKEVEKILVENAKLRKALGIARNAMDKASKMYFRDLKGIDKMLAEQDDNICEALKGGK